MKTSLVLALACLALQSTAPAQAQQPETFRAHQFNLRSAHDRVEIEEVLKRYEQALNAGDVEGVVALYTEGGVLMAPNSPSAVGIQAVRDSYVATFEAIRLDISFQMAELHVLSPEWAFLRSNSTGVITIVADGTSIPEGNQELFILRKLYGEWKIARYSFSTFLPAAPI
jgi:uncharacterized protein (TIGR02246 family)